MANPEIEDEALDSESELGLWSNLKSILVWVVIVLVLLVFSPVIGEAATGLWSFLRAVVATIIIPFLCGVALFALGCVRAVIVSNATKVEEIGEAAANAVLAGIAFFLILFLFSWIAPDSYEDAFYNQTQKYFEAFADLFIRKK